ncbi:helix-turn-helix domain-containing protein [Streptomyces sp. BG9H]|uniref:Helix-turn-helix domain-containing protein n=1 Tax=Streptomyces anatolicus TaxID=2675858 RepID=A0ABS6YLT2_9ACTN|nr:helix-turn-helix domain-containing protein [Streptomyces anatolicus]MBW5422368.1 helix-turn-helix domain-containing protein [Streptomyces anatolicus]
MPDARREDLGRMLRAWRMARDPRLVPGPVPFRGHRGYLTQLDMALLLGVSERWYRALERGEDRGYAPEMIAGVARILDLSPARTEALFRGTGHRPPRRPAHRARPDEAMLDLLHQQRRVSWICDPAWDVVAVNAVAARHCPWLTHPDANVMTWAFSPQARYQLRDWESRWAGPLLARLRLAWQRMPDDERLDEVVRAVRGEPGVAALWDGAADVPDPDEARARPVYFPLVSPDPVDVRVRTYGRYDDDALRWIVVTPVDTGVTFP